MLEVEKLVKLKQSISSVTEIQDLRSLRDQFQLSIHADEQLLSRDSIAKINMLINEMHDLIQKKVIELAELLMVGEGLGPPPTSYSYLLLGSAGRYEQTLASDQDSALIYENEYEIEEVKTYYYKFTHHIVNTLVELGYPRCDGRVQSDEEAWCLSVKQWKQKLDYWYEEQSWETVRYLLIMADSRSIAGDEVTYFKVKRYYENYLTNNKQILGRMINNTIQYKVVLGLFGQFIKERYGEEKGYIDIKYGSYIPLISSIRWLSLWNNVYESSTLTRLEQLKKHNVLSQKEYEIYYGAVLKMLGLRLYSGYEILDNQYEGKTKLDPKRLEKNEIREIKTNFRIGKELQKKILKEFARHK